MTHPLTKEQRAELFESGTGWSTVERELLDSHELADEALDLATAKLATAKVCEDCWRYQDNEKCDCCNNGVRFSDDRARELLERLKRAEEDSARLQWYLSDKPKAFLDTYMQGVREQWDIERWRREIDSAIAKEGSSS